MDNFYVTAERMYNDLDLLYNQRRWFNSCYFSGYVVECYAKLILSQVFGKNPNEIKALFESSKSWQEFYLICYPLFYIWFLASSVVSPSQKPPGVFVKEE